jgi:hypothetical protein
VYLKSWMAGIQHQDARRLLGIISSAIEYGNRLTYWEAARRMGRVPPGKHSRAVAQMCDLLDAAACVAGVPLLALVAVREKSGEINPNAWKDEYGPRRDAIIRRSLDHQFLPENLEAISSALDDLGERGNKKAWAYVKSMYPGDLLFKRRIADYADAIPSAIDDLGTDSPDRAKAETWSYARDPKVRAAVLKRADGKCEFCDKLGFMKADGTRYLESHHVIALAADGADRLTNVIALCPDDHREAHFGARSEEIEREMIMRLRAVNL